MKLYFDENVDVLVAVRLQADGFNVVTARDVGLLGVTDEAQLAFAAEQERVLFTHDAKDFSALASDWFRENRRHCGILYASFESPPVLAEWIRHAFEVYTPEDLVNVTIRLPID